MLAGAYFKSVRVELYSPKADVFRKTHDLPLPLDQNLILQTADKVSDVSDKCKGEEAGTILNIGGSDGTSTGTSKIWAFSFQHGWLETQSTLPALQSRFIQAVAIP